MRLIHCADLHLDSKMEANLPASQARERKAELLGTFARLVAFARQQQADGVLICGDLFDTERVSAKTLRQVLDMMAKAADVEFFWLRGNHDGNLLGGELPENVRIFEENWTCYRRGGVVIAGLEPENWETMYEDLKLPENTVNIVLLHGQVSTQPGEDLIALPKLRGRNIDYLALGHLHSYRKEALDDRGSWCYCGCLEGRGFDECGQKGFVLLDIENGSVKTTFVPFASRQLHEVAVDITDCIRITHLQTAMEQAAAGIGPDAMVKFTLTGTYTPETQMDRTYLTRYFGQKFYFVKIKDESRFRIDPGSYEHDISLKGEFIRLVMASGKTEEEKGRIICAGLQALAGEEVTV